MGCESTYEGHRKLNHRLDGIPDAIAESKGLNTTERDILLLVDSWHLEVDSVRSVEKEDLWVGYFGVGEKNVLLAGGRIFILEIQVQVKASCGGLFKLKVNSLETVA